MRWLTLPMRRQMKHVLLWTGIGFVAARFNLTSAALVFAVMLTIAIVGANLLGRSGEE